MSCITQRTWKTYELEELHTPYQCRTILAALSTAAAIFLIAGAVVVIMGAALCLAIPGVHVVSGIILPGFLPALGAIVLSLPFLVITYLIRQSAHPIRKEVENRMMDKIRRRKLEELVDEIITLKEEIKDLKQTRGTKEARKAKRKEIDRKTKKEFDVFFKHEILTKGNTHYKAGLLTQLKKRYEKTEKYHAKRLDPDYDGDDYNEIIEDDEKAVIALCKEMVSLIELLKQKTLHPKAKAWNKKKRGK